MASISEMMSGMVGGHEAPQHAPKHEVEHEAAPHAGIHEGLRKAHAEHGGKHMHIHHDGMGGIQSHHIGEDGEPQGPHDHANIEALKEHMGQFLDEEGAEQGDEYEGKPASKPEPGRKGKLFG